MKYVKIETLLDMEPSIYQEIKVSPENYREILKFAEIANKNKDVEIILDTNMVDESCLDSPAFYGVEIAMLRKTHKPNGIMRYFLCCNNAIRD